MSDLIRRAYGYGGAGGERILVSAPYAELAPPPRWLRILQLAVLLIIPVLVSRFALPKAGQQRTVIDMSRLDVKPVPESPIMPKPTPPVERPVLPEVKPEAPPAPVVARTVEQPSIASPVPVITRPNLIRETPLSRPRARERSRADIDTGAPAATRIRRETTAGVEPAARTTITRTRGVATGIEVPGAAPRIVLQHRAAGSVEGTEGAPAVSIARRGRSLTPCRNGGGAPDARRGCPAGASGVRVRRHRHRCRRGAGGFAREPGCLSRSAGRRGWYPGGSQSCRITAELHQFAGGVPVHSHATNIVVQSHDISRQRAQAIQ